MSSSATVSATSSNACTIEADLIPIEEHGTVIEQKTRPLMFLKLSLSFPVLLPSLVDS